MVDPVREVRKDTPPASSDAWVIDDLRQSIAAIADDVKQVAEARSRVAKKQAQDITAALRHGIRQEPIPAMAIAVAAGAALALAAMSHSRRSPRSDAWHASMPSVTRADLYDLAERVQRSATRAADTVPLFASFERLLDALSKAEPGAPLAGALEKAGSLLQKLRSAVKI